MLVQVLFPAFILLSTDFICAFAWNEEPVAKILSPLTYTAWEGQDTTGGFTCSVDHSNNRFVRWIVDGYQEDSTYILNREIRVTNDINSVPGRIISNIFIPASSQNSHGIICKCRAYTPDYVYVESEETAYFEVQGLLQLSLNMSLVSFNRSHMMVVWQEPSTLNITEIEPDVYGYTVCVNVPNFDTINTSCGNQTTANIFLPKLFVNTTVIISAWNIVGESNRVNWTVKPACSADMDLRKQELNSEVTAITSFYENLTKIYFTFQKRDIVENECLAKFIAKFINFESNVTVLETSLLNGYPNNNLSIVSRKIPKNTKFLALIRVNPSVEYSYVYQTYFTTYDVQNIDISVETQIIIIRCHFAYGSNAIGCKVEVISHKNTLRHIIFKKECVLNSSALCLVNISLIELEGFGNLTIMVYDWEEDGNITRVFSREFTVTTSHKNPHPNADTETQLKLDLIVGVNITGGIFLTATIMVFIITITLITRARKKRKNKRTMGKHERKYKQNSAFSFALNIKRNEAYVDVYSVQDSIPTVQPHVYEVIQTPKQSPTKHVYITVA